MALYCPQVARSFLTSECTALELTQLLMPLPERIINRLRSVKNRTWQWCRTCARAGSTLLVRTNVRLWHQVAQAGTPSWDERNRIMAGFIAAGSSVLDVGCGAQTLRQHLPPGCRYQPCDVVKSSPEVIYCDFNTGVYPEFQEPFDYVVCSGVLEYIRQPREFLQRIRPWGRVILLSYVPLPSDGSKLERMGNGWGWVNHFKQEELESMLDQLEYKRSLRHTDKLHYVIYSLTVKP